MRINFGELVIGDTAKEYLQQVLDKNWASEGDNVKEFEEKFAAHFGYKHAIATSSGTDANICSCAALYDFGAKRGDEIITPALSFVATANSILGLAKK
jgi:dTDP-4-amino-4,6-dideoxygalactose transaminase